MTSTDRIVVVGAGHAGFQAAAELRQAGFEGSVTLVETHDTPDLPYQRPPLSKDYLAGKVGSDHLRLRPKAYYDKKHIELRIGNPAARLDRAAGKLELRSGESLPYDHLVLATGARARELHVAGADLDGVATLRTFSDAARLREGLGRARHVAIIGGGFIGLECAAVARARGADVVVVEALERTMARVVSPEISHDFSQLHADHGTRVLHETTVARLHGDGDGRVAEIELGNGDRLPADLVVVGIGVTPNVELAEEAGLAVDDGVVVDQHLCTDDPAIWAIGDCAAYPSPHANGARVRLESVQNATGHGRHVAAELTGKAATYAAAPWFWTDQYDRRLQIVGLVGDHTTTVRRGDPAEGSYSLFCFHGERLLGVESVNRARDHIAARRLLDNDMSLHPDQAADADFDLKAHALGT